MVHKGTVLVYLITYGKGACGPQGDSIGVSDYIW